MRFFSRYLCSAAGSSCSRLDHTVDSQRNAFQNLSSTPCFLCSPDFSFLLKLQCVAPWLDSEAFWRAVTNGVRAVWGTKATSSHFSERKAGKAGMCTNLCYLNPTASRSEGALSETLHAGVLHSEKAPEGVYLVT